MILWIYKIVKVSLIEIKSVQGNRIDDQKDKCREWIFFYYFTKIRRVKPRLFSMLIAGWKIWKRQSGIDIFLQTL